jgi:peptidoglycan hydrolase-like protein with peptidoglycan-binding domain
MAKYYASKVVDLARSWIGRKESNGTHKAIIDIYNSYVPHPRGYKMTYDAPWCAATVSAVSIKLGYTDIMPVECSCSKMIEQYKALGCWVEADNRKPKAGDLIFYDWDDNGKGDNVGSPDHIGIVEKVVDNKITVIEGNYSNAVKRRTLDVNGKYIRGYAVPKYDAEVKKETKPITTYSKTQFIKDVQSATGSVVDGIAGKETIGNTITVSKVFNRKHKVVKAIQKRLNALGYNCGTVDGIAGVKFDAAVKAYQKANGCVVDGIISAQNKTWKKLLGMI